MKQRELIDEAVRVLAASGVEDPSRDARKLLRHVVSSPSHLLDLEMDVSSGATKAFKRMITERASHRPVAQITGTREFWGRDFIVTSDTLDPRPETELIIEMALERSEGNRLLDLGTGTGCLLLTLLSELPHAKGVGTDVSNAALAVANKNAQSLGLKSRAAFVLSDWFSALSGHFDLIVCNPPYIPENEIASLAPDVREWEPHLALTPGKDGLSAYRTISQQADRFLADQGLLLFEVGAGQAREVADILVQAGLRIEAIGKDLGGIDRVVSARKPS